MPVAFQCLIQPELDDRTGSSRQVPAHIGKFGWTMETNCYAWRSFLGQEPGTEAEITLGLPLTSTPVVKLMA